MTLKRIVEETIHKEIQGLNDLAKHLNIEQLEELIEKIHFLSGKVIVSGIGKSGHIAKKIAASICSVGTPAIFLHSAEALHGDLGMIASNDIVMIFSNSGSGQELIKIMNYCQNLKVQVIGISRDGSSYLANKSDMSFVLPNTPEVSNLDIPTTSSTMMLVFGDVLTIALKEKNKLCQEKYVIYHPGGKIGMKNMKIKNVMLKKSVIPILHYKTSILETAILMSIKKLGFAIVTDDDGVMLGITNANSLTAVGENAIAFDCMTNEYRVVSGDTKVDEIINDKYEYFIVLHNGKPEGVFINDVFTKII